MATHRTYMIVIEADDSFDEYYNAAGNVTHDPAEQVELSSFADTEKLQFIMNSWLPSQGVTITDLSGYA